MQAIAFCGATSTHGPASHFAALTAQRLFYECPKHSNFAFKNDVEPSNTNAAFDVSAALNGYD